MQRKTPPGLFDHANPTNSTLWNDVNGLLILQQHHHSFLSKLNCKFSSPLKELSAKTNFDHCDYLNLQTASDRVVSICDHVEQMTEQSIRLEKKMELAAKISFAKNDNITLALPHRKYLFDETVTLTTSFPVRGRSIREKVISPPSSFLHPLPPPFSIPSLFLFASPSLLLFPSPPSSPPFSFLPLHFPLLLLSPPLPLLSLSSLRLFLPSPLPHLVNLLGNFMSKLIWKMKKSPFCF